MTLSIQPRPFAPARTPIEWRISTTPVGYDEAVAAMEARAGAIRSGVQPECVWLLEHPALYTAGTSAKRSELLQPNRLPVFRTGRGGRYTYHGPGQRVAYVMVDLSVRGRDVRAYVSALEDWLIAALAELGLEGERRPGAVGIFVEEAKIASIGVRIRRWVSFHGISLNVDPDLEHFSGIVPCGLENTEITSLRALGATTDTAHIDDVLRRSFRRVFDDPAG